MIFNAHPPAFSGCQQKMLSAAAPGELRGQQVAKTPLKGWLTADIYWDKTCQLHRKEAAFVSEWQIPHTAEAGGKAGRCKYDE